MRPSVEKNSVTAQTSSFAKWGIDLKQPELHFDRDEYARRIEKTRLAMSAKGVELIVVSDASNMAWLTGYDGWSFYVHQCVLLGLEGEPVWYGRGQDANGAKLTSFLTHENIIGYSDHYVQSADRHAMDYLSERIVERGWGKRNIGVEMDNYWFSAAAFAALQKHLPNAKFSDTTGLVNWQRAVKSEQELGYMRKAARIVERMHQRIIDKVEPGIRKCDLVADIYDAALRYDDAIGVGGDYPAIVPLLPSGEGASAPHLTWDDQPMKNGEGTFFEIAGVYRRYHCPVSRSVFLGKPTKAFLNAEKAVLESMDAGLEVAKSGNRCEDVANAFFAVLKNMISRKTIVRDIQSGCLTPLTGANGPCHYVLVIGLYWKKI